MGASRSSIARSRARRARASHTARSRSNLDLIYPNFHPHSSSILHECAIQSPIYGLEVRGVGWRKLSYPHSPPRDMRKMSNAFQTLMGRTCQMHQMNSKFHECNMRVCSVLCKTLICMIERESTGARAPHRSTAPPASSSLCECARAADVQATRGVTERAGF